MRGQVRPSLVVKVNYGICARRMSMGMRDRGEMERKPQTFIVVQRRPECVRCVTIFSVSNDPRNTDNSVKRAVHHSLVDLCILGCA